MLTSAYSVHDSVADFFGTPFFSTNDNVAIRSFSALVHDPQSFVSRNPGDFTLYRIGTFDDKTGLFEKFDIPFMVTRATSLLNSSVASDL